MDLAVWVYGLSSSLHRWVSSWHVFSPLCTRALRNPRSAAWTRQFAISAWHRQIENRMDALLRRLLCCFGARRRHGRPRQRHGGRGGDARGDDAAARKSFLRRTTTRPSGAARLSRSADVERLETPKPRRRRWPRPRGMNRVFAQSPPCGTTTRAVEPRPVTSATAATAVPAEGGAGNQEFPVEHSAAATIQAHFRGHLARQAFRALRSLVKLQAFARGAYVRKQANVAIRFMKVLVRLQVRVRSRQLLLSTPSRYTR
uniref:DUF4005 domain-containing protein n=1 Tax=Setaria viridis TaxID=4556 RepID=A0A4U6TSY4_SETVI|nr:hypothetical protein SEVIR_7G209700v2 [Setaria viridis]